MPYQDGAPVDSRGCESLEEVGNKSTERTSRAADLVDAKVGPVFAGVDAHEIGRAHV